MHSDPRSQPPGPGESLSEFFQRVSTKMGELAGAHPGKTLLLTVHGGVLTMIMKMILQEPLESPRFFGITNAAISEISWSKAQGWFLTSWNSTSHLKGTGFSHH